MEEYIGLLKQSPLFDGLDEGTIMGALSHLEAYTSAYEKYEMIYPCIEAIRYAGMVLQGDVMVGMSTAEGNEHTMRHFRQGELFAMAYACVPSPHDEIQLVAQQPCQILFLKLSNLLEHSASDCPHVARITTNLLRLMATSNLIQQKKIEILSYRHIRERITIYLKGCEIVEGKVHLPFNRQDFANYLGVDRSALSRELGKMREEGLLDYHKSTIILAPAYHRAL